MELLWGEMAAQKRRKGEGVAGAGDAKRNRDEDGTEEGAWMDSERMPDVDEVAGCFV